MKTLIKKEKKQVTIGLAIIPVLSLIIFLTFTITVFKQPPHIPLLLATAVAAAIAAALHYPWNEIQEGITKGIAIALAAVLILLVIGTMIGTWILSGVVPTMIFYGLKILSPKIFLVSTLIICSIISLGTGSSWSTAATAGVALIGIGKGLGIPAPMVAGAIISGAYFGDKMSPISDTTNLAPAVSGTDVFSHVRHMVYTTAPAYVISVLLFILLGSRTSGGTLDMQKIELMLSTIKTHFSVHPILFLPPLLVILMVVLKIPPLPALFSQTILGGILAVTVQSKSLAEVMQAAQSGYISQTGVRFVDDLLTRGGLESMLRTVALIICALSFGGVMEKTGMLDVLVKSLLKKVKKTGSLVATTVGSCIAMNAIAAEQYTAIVVTGRMFKNAFDQHGLHPKNLSRCLEDAGTLTSSLVPWSVCGAFMHATLGVSPLLYLPYAFLNLINPAITVLYGYTGITMTKKQEVSSS
ncbi:MAG: Na+/H+ antiporter NhaC [Candidatus Aminicenantes bacterium]|nr:Na+/H+ antiporter NhaC [Candidatus Aminicenantes bacterium]